MSEKENLPEETSGNDSNAERNLEETLPDGFKSVKRKIEKELRKLLQRKKEVTDLSKDSAALDDLTQKQYEELSEVDRATYTASVKHSPASLKHGENITKETPQQPRREYDFSHKRRGIAVLNIYSQFQNQPEREPAFRYDYWNMKEIFEALDFDVKEIINAGTEELQRRLRDIRDSIQTNGTKGDDCFACVISSHGAEVRKPSSDIREHVLYTYDGAVKTEEILQMFNNRNCKALRGKPKLFFIQACRGVLPEEPGRQDIDHGAPVYVTDNTGNEGFWQRMQQSAKDVPGTRGMEDTVSHSKESTPDTRQNYREYYQPTQKSTVAQQCESAMGEIDSIAKRIQQRTMHMQEQSNQQVSVQHIKTVHKVEQSVQGIQYADDEFYDNVQGIRTQTHIQTSVQQKKISPPVFQPLDFCSVPVFSDYLVMFSAASGTIAWSDGDKGGWLLYCLYHVAKALRNAYFRADLLGILTDTAGKMAREIQANSSDPRYHGAKAAAVIYHRLRKEIYLTPKQFDVITEI